MKKFASLIMTVSLIFTMGICLTACSGDDKPKETETTPSSESVEETTTTTTTEATTSAISEMTGPLPTTESVTWTLNQLQEPQSLYSKVSGGNFLNVRTGPGTTYPKAGTLTRGQVVKVVAKTNNNWYQTEDGFYISAEYLTSTAPQ